MADSLFQYAPVAGLVTIICPVYNGARYLAEALESVRAQSYPAVEILCVDDGSTDNSAEIAESIPGVRCLRRPQGGVSKARNYGIREARGEFIGFIDSDDRYVAGRIERYVRRFTEEPELWFIDGRIRAFLDGVSELPSWVPEISLAEEGVHFHALGTVLVRRQVFEQVGLFNEELRFAEDTDWLLRIRDAGLKQYTETEVVLERRVHEDNTSYQNKTPMHPMFKILHESIKRRRAGVDRSS